VLVITNPKKALKIFYEQFANAYEIIEYISWLTASIFSVLSILTIFLAFQFQNNMVQLHKIIWDIRKKINEKQVEDIILLLDNFSFLIKQPTIVRLTMNISKKLLIILIPIWTLCTISILLNKGISESGSIQYISFLLIIVTSWLFIYLAVKLITLLNKISKNDFPEYRIKNGDQIFDVVELVKENFEIKQMFEIDYKKIEMIISGDKPYTTFNTLRNFGFYNYHILISMESYDEKIHIGKYVDSFSKNKDIQFDIVETSAITINKLFTSRSIDNFDIYVSFIVNNEVKSYNCFVETDSFDGELPRVYNVQLNNEARWNIPEQIKKQLITSNQVEVVEELSK